MNINTMRSIDKRLGIPLCFLMRIVLGIVDIFRPKKKPTDLSRTLWIELSEMGSALLADPAMRYVATHAGSELYFVIFQQNAESLDILNTIPQQRRFTIRTTTMWVLTADVFRFMRWCRKKRITAVIDLELYSRFTALLGVLSGSRHRIGFCAHHDEGFYRGNLINYPVRYNPHVHITVNFMALAYKATGKFDSPYARVAINKDEISLQTTQPTASEIEKVKTMLSAIYQQWEEKKIIIFNINASDMLPQRKWMLDSFIQTAVRLLSEQENIVIVATGTKEENTYIQTFIDGVGDNRCVSVAEKCCLRQLVALYALSTCMLSNDSGPAHFASAIPLKTFVLFGPETPALYMPLGDVECFYAGLTCSPCVSAANHRKTDCSQPLCMQSISVEEVSSKMIIFLESIK